MSSERILKNGVLRRGETQRTLFANDWLCVYAKRKSGAKTRAKRKSNNGIEYFISIQDNSDSMYRLRVGYQIKHEVVQYFIEGTGQNRILPADTKFYTWKSLTWKYSSLNQIEEVLPFALMKWNIKSIFRANPT